jgi:hypothetical protein
MPCGMRLLASTLSLQLARWRPPLTTFCRRYQSLTCLLVILRSTPKIALASSLSCPITQRLIAIGFKTGVTSSAIRIMFLLGCPRSGDQTPRFLTRPGGSRRREKVSPTVLSVSHGHLQGQILAAILLTRELVEYHSWNAGPRSCLGRALATYEGITISTAIIQRFDIILSDNRRVYEPLAALNMVRPFCS